MEVPAIHRWKADTHRWQDPWVKCNIKGLSKLVRTLEQSYKAGGLILSRIRE